MDNAVRETIVKELNKPGLSLTRLAEVSGVHKSQVSRFKKGEFRRPSKNLLKVCEKLHICNFFATPDNDLTSAVHYAWDGSAAGKKRLLAILEALRGWG